jgi:glutathione S-transferase
MPANLNFCCGTMPRCATFTTLHKKARSLCGDRQVQATEEAGNRAAGTAGMILPHGRPEMKLYYSPGACSLASHITLNEAGVAFTAEKVDLRQKRTESGADFAAINPRGAVPALELDGGEVLTEGVSIMQHVMDSAAPGKLPAPGTLGRARLTEAMNYVSTEVHKTYSPFFRGLEGEAKTGQMAVLDARLQVVEDRLAKREWLAGDAYTPADAYFFTVTNWSKGVGHDLSRFPKVEALRAKVAARPAVQKAMQAEGLI